MLKMNIRDVFLYLKVGLSSHYSKVKSALFMKTKAILLVLLVSICFYTVSIQAVKSQNNEGIYIRADGNIIPSTAPIQKVGELYTFTSNVNTSIVVERNNVVINGADYVLPSLNLIQRKNVTIENVNGYIWFVNVSSSLIYGCKGSIRLENSFNNSIFENDLESNPIGILLTNSHNNSIRGNNITGTRKGSFGISLASSENNTLYENNIAGNSVGLGLSGNSTNNSIIKNNFINNDENAGGWESFPNTWDDGKIGNYWSDSTNASSYTIQIHFLKDNSTKLDYDHKPQLQPFVIPEFPSLTILLVVLITIVPLAMLCKRRCQV